MPIRPENRGRYPADWPDISRRIRFDRAKGRCECDGRCGRPPEHLGPDPIEREDPRPTRCVNHHGEPAYGTGSTVVLTTAHLNHTPEQIRKAVTLLVEGTCRHAGPYPMPEAAQRMHGRETYTCGLLVGHDGDHAWGGADVAEDELTTYARHCENMAVATHQPTCSAKVPHRINRVYPDPDCPGCVTEADRALWALLAAEAVARLNARRQEALW